MTQHLAVSASAAVQRTPARPVAAPHRTVHGVLAGAGVLGTVVVLCAQLLAPDALRAASPALVVAGILLGIPHGAVDHMVPFWTGAARPSRSSLIAVLARYAVVGCAAVAALVLFRDAAVVLFLVASALHFGRAEVQFAAEVAGRPAPAAAEEWPLTLAHGAAVVLLPLGLWHAQVAATLAGLSPLLDGAPAASLLRLAAVATLGLTAVVVTVLLRRGRVREAAELGLVTALFVVVPPLPAFAVYFGGWHAARHTGRLLALPGPDGRPLRPSAAVRRYAVHAAAPTAAVVAVLALVWSRGSSSALVGALGVLLALTFPHLETVAGLDRWAAGAARPRRGRPGQRGAGVGA